ncbi:Glycosyltransferase involved in cell wall bisynthesis [Geoalkalibacter ferrihydriticus]|uniref:Glycosyltransferase involved in cell wall bisynthesis n=1 Tax=Geoalkalibacter ferrihydriticus TaxID=392333 RepID=A0A1G9U5V4_9BACT|nr:glycosyltransferase family 1 protein [Geoalkalibacter ferrihydriticus]SDM55024.1 Glycosyltransferase involved in cell wall bisynthesis [Geoalkalibacter ferrihydriticus]
MKKPLKIALVTETYLPQINGVSKTLDRLVTHLQSQGDSVHLLIPRYRDNPPQAKPGLEVTAFGALSLPNYPEILLPFTRPGRVRRILRDIAPDVIHIATEGPLGWAALLAARKLGVPMISSYHTNFSQYMVSYRLGFIETSVWRYLRWFHNQTARTFCPTPSIRDILHTEGFERVGTWGRGVDCERFDPVKRDARQRRELGFAPEDVVFVYCGRLAAEKNLPMLMNAFRDLADPRARLMLIGDGPLRTKLAAEADQRVVFTGYQQGEELARLYAAADIMAFPSLTETFGNVMLEAMASGLPVIGFKVPGPQDIVCHGTTGHLVTEISAPAFTRAMARFLADGEAIRRTGANARAFAQRQNWHQINEVVRQAYLQARAGAQISTTAQDRAPQSSASLKARDSQGDPSC